ncbi:hypothetical protein Y032_0424g1225 [Ancylostoma ceylanicum]|uniref:Uncharacterized protein n=1 Tax=Ancylostoma ceylanicum TaxID=53326 RepID=A0A016X2V7_9BILA|nr:hypothetical protein Y032_0424g1225 [Ancylostoma ceylanicum]
MSVRSLATVCYVYINSRHRRNAAQAFFVGCLDITRHALNLEKRNDAKLTIISTNHGENQPIRAEVPVRLARSRQPWPAHTTTVRQASLHCALYRSHTWMRDWKYGL